MTPFSQNKNAPRQKTEMESERERERHKMSVFILYCLSDVTLSLSQVSIAPPMPVLTNESKAFCEANESGIDRTGMSDNLHGHYKSISLTRPHSPFGNTLFGIMHGVKLNCQRLCSQT